MGDLFGGEKKAGEADKKGGSPRPNMWLEAARRIGGFGDDWFWFKMEMIGNAPNYQGNMVTGGVPTRRYEKGPRAGRWDWREVRDEKEQSVFVTMAERDAQKRIYETTTGNCVECGGTGQAFAGSGPEGTTYKPCKRCGATGKAPATATGVASSPASSLAVSHCPPAVRTAIRFPDLSELHPPLELPPMTDVMRYEINEQLGYLACSTCGCQSFKCDEEPARCANCGLALAPEVAKQLADLARAKRAAAKPMPTRDELEALATKWETESKRDDDGCIEDADWAESRVLKACAAELRALIGGK